MNRKIDVNNICGIVIIILVIGMSPAAFVSNNYSKIMAIMLASAQIMVLPLLILTIMNYKFHRELLMLCVLPVVFFFMKNMNSLYDKIVYSYALLLLIMYLLVNDTLKSKWMKMFYYVFIVLGIISVALIILYILKIDFIFQKVPYYSGDIRASYMKCGPFAIYIYDDGAPRLCGVFNEPGLLGTIAGFLYVMSYNKNSLKEKIILLVIGLFSVSTAFFVLVLLFHGMLFWIQDRKNMFKTICFVLVVSIFVICIYKSEHNVLDIEYYLRRILKLKEALAQRNANPMFKSAFDEFKHSSHLFLGMGYGSTNGFGYVGAMGFVYQFGIIPTTLYIFMFFAFGYMACKGEKYAYLYMIIFLISFIQRAAIDNIYAYFMYFGGLAWMTDNEQLLKKRRSNY